MFGAILDILKGCLASIYLTCSTLLHERTHHIGTQVSIAVFSFSITIAATVAFSFSITFAARGSGTKRYVAAARRGSSGAIQLPCTGPCRAWPLVQP